MKNMMNKENFDWEDLVSLLILLNADEELIGKIKELWEKNQDENNKNN